MTIDRREFLRNSAMAGPVLALAGQSMAQSAAEPEPWFDRPMRWAQLTLVEDDPGKYDPNFWLDYFKRTHSRCRVPERRRMRGLLSDQDSAALPQPVARQIATRSANWWPAAAS